MCRTFEAPRFMKLADYLEVGSVTNNWNSAKCIMYLWYIQSWFEYYVKHKYNVSVLKILGLYLLGQNCLHLTFEQYLSSETYSRKYMKLPNIVILACKNITEKMHLLKMCGPQIWLCLFTFRSIASKQLNGLTTIDTVSWLAGAVVTHPL